MSTTTAPDRIQASTAREWLQRTDAVTVIDVRSPAEFDTARIRGSINVPLPRRGEHAGQLAGRLGREVVLVCQTGARATQAQQRLAGAGEEPLHVLDGGIAAFGAAGGQVVRGRARWSLERQVVSALTDTCTMGPRPVRPAVQPGGGQPQPAGGPRPAGRRPVPVVSSEPAPAGPAQRCRR